MSPRPSQGHRGHCVNSYPPKAWNEQGESCAPRATAARRIELRGRYRFGADEPWHGFRVTLVGPEAHLRLRRVIHLIGACADGPPSEELLDALASLRRRHPRVSVEETRAPTTPVASPAAAGEPLTIDVLCGRRSAQLDRNAKTAANRSTQAGERRTVHRALREYFADRDLTAAPITEEDIEEWAAWRVGVNYRTRDAHARRCTRCARHVHRSDPACRKRPAESATARTLQFGLQEFRAVLLCGRKVLGEPPSTPDLKRRIQASMRTVHATRDCPAPDQVNELGRAMRDRTVRGVSGARWALAIPLAGRMGLRLEEVTAAFAQDFHLDTAQPHMVVSGAESRRPADPLGPDAASRRQPLKQRAVGETRVVAIPDDLVEPIREHIEKYATPNGRMFTGVQGGWWSRDTAWKRTWWRPIVDDVLGDSTVPALRTLQFRRLRHAAITAWIYSGISVGDAALAAGNSESVIRKHYADAIAEAEMRVVPLFGSRAPRADDTDPLDQRDAEDLFAARAAIDAEIERRQRQALGVSPGSIAASA